LQFLANWWISCNFSNNLAKESIFDYALKMNWMSMKGATGTGGIGWNKGSNNWT